ncbi:hypothetical protein ALT761_00089 [Alteromonas sp. 76-1]|jgi:hypothetical protein|uniref:hypothetical protein n=1 Tax=Alteromonas sp. 76-1 TaxID=2358187 RepID=UPI000FD15FBD|nr:hypothetical protein [Alteromonas sp. 76-1]VEL95139.1 hypothetical protein ALT761_00089 [Alteromonas sp. 76-1]
MDIFELVFASYLEAVSNSVYNELSDIRGIEVQAQVVTYNDLEISYSYQLWKIQTNSICGIYDRDLNAKSKCSVSAKSMFGEMCSYLQKNPKPGWQYSKLKNMYCSAATNYKPIIASVTLEGKTNSEKKREECSIATLRVMQSASAANLAAKEKACKKTN